MTNGGATMWVVHYQILEAFDHVTVVRDLENQSSYRRNADFYLSVTVRTRRWVMVCCLLSVMSSIVS